MSSARTASPATDTKAKASDAPTTCTYHASGRLAGLDRSLILKPTVISREISSALLAGVNALAIRCKRIRPIPNRRQRRKILITPREDWTQNR